LKLREYQDKGADFLYNNDRAIILASVGAGKTALTLVAMSDMLRDGFVSRWLVVAPKRVCLHTWTTELIKWAPHLSMAIAVGTPKERIAALEANTDLCVVNYDCLQWLSEQSLNFDGIVFDELTRLSNPSGLRFKALLKILENIRIRWGLTGSFTSNGLENVFGQCKVINERLLGRAKGAFLQQYFYCVNRDFGEWEPIPYALEQVMERIKPATFLLENSEYKDGLPQLHIVEMHCDIKDRKPYDTLKKEFVVNFPTAEIVAANAGVVTQKLTQLASGFIYDPAHNPIWHSYHKFELLDEILEENQHANTLIFYNFKAELAELQLRYPHAVMLDAPDAIERWNRGEIELLLAHPKSAQYGLNLQHGGSKIVFTTLPWSLTDFEQAIGRLHRSGQTDAVYVYVLMANKTIDDHILGSLHDKKSLSELALEALK